LQCDGCHDDLQEVDWKFILIFVNFLEISNNPNST